MTNAQPDQPPSADDALRIDARPLDGSEPLYLQLAAELRRHIRCSLWRDDEQIPTEHALCTAYRVSRITVRRAIDLLVQEKLLYRARPRGTFVRPACQRNNVLTTLHRGFTEKLLEQGRDPRTLAARIRLTHAAPEVAEQLACAPGAEVLCLERLRGDGRRAFAYFETWLSPHPELPLDDAAYYGSLYQMLRERGLILERRWESFEAVGADERLAELLDVPRETALLRRCIMTRDDAQAFGEYTICHYVGSEYNYRFEYN